MDLSIDDMLDRFNAMVQDVKIDPSEADDITMVGVEILWQQNSVESVPSMVITIYNLLSIRFALHSTR